MEAVTRLQPVNQSNLGIIQPFNKGHTANCLHLLYLSVSYQPYALTALLCLFLLNFTTPESLSNYPAELPDG